MLTWKEVFDELIPIQRSLDQYIYESQLPKTTPSISPKTLFLTSYTSAKYELNKTLRDIKLTNLIMLLNYAIHDELYEYRMAQEKEPAQEEAIDILHFILAEMEITDTEFQEVNKKYNIEEVLYNINRIINWKWWKEPKPIDENLLKRLINELANAWVEIAEERLNLTPNKALEIYMKKNKINKERQDNNY